MKTGTYFVGLDVSLFGEDCVNTGNHAGTEVSSWVKVLNGNYAGCDALGADTSSSVSDFDNYRDWLTSNTDKLNLASVGNPLYTSMTSSNDKVYLNARYRVSTKCSAECRGFRFGTSLPGLRTGVLATYSSILTIAYLAGFGAFVCLIYLIFVILQGSSAT
jgi:hypothetical protein